MQVRPAPNTTPRSCAVDIGFQNCQLVLIVVEIEQVNVRNKSAIVCFGSNSANYTHYSHQPHHPISSVIFNYHNNANSYVRSCGLRAKSCFSSWAWTIRNGETPYVSKICCQHFGSNVSAISTRRIPRADAQATSTPHDRCFDIPSGQLSAPSTTRNESLSGT
jgi:hypothetical protein